MRVATWNVNSLKARMEKVEWWLDRAKPDVLLIQETKLADHDAPTMAFSMAGYDFVHHGEGRWNGVAIAARRGAHDQCRLRRDPRRERVRAERAHRRVAVLRGQAQLVCAPAAVAARCGQ